MVRGLEVLAVAYSSSSPMLTTKAPRQEVRPPTGRPARPEVHPSRLHPQQRQHAAVLVRTYALLGSVCRAG